MIEDRIFFPSQRNSADFELEGIISKPDGFPLSGAVLCHPHPMGGGNMNVPLLFSLARLLVSNRVTVLRFNFGGVGNSGGYFTDGKEEVFDVKAAAGYLGSSIGIPPERMAIAGWSFGSLMALRAVSEGLKAALIVAISPPVAVIDWMDFSKDLSRTPGLRYYLAGDRDDLCPSQLLIKFAENISDRERERIYLIPGADHFLFGQDEEVSKLVVDIFRTCGLLDQ